VGVSGNTAATVAAGFGLDSVADNHAKDINGLDVIE